MLFFSWASRGSPWVSGVSMRRKKRRTTAFSFVMSRTPSTSLRPFGEIFVLVQRSHAARRSLTPEEVTGNEARASRIDPA